METTKTESPEDENFITKGPSNPDDLCKYKKKKKHPIIHTSICFETVYVEIKPEKKLCRFTSEASKSDKNLCNSCDSERNLHK